MKHFKIVVHDLTIVNLNLYKTHYTNHRRENLEERQWSTYLSLSCWYFGQVLLCACIMKIIHTAHCNTAIHSAGDGSVESTDWDCIVDKTIQQFHAVYKHRGVCVCVCVCVCVFVGVIYEKGREIFIEKEKRCRFWKAFVNFPARSCSSIRAGRPKYDSHSPSSK